jgi:hypothetical protein
MREVLDLLVPVERIELPTFGLQNQCFPEKALCVGLRVTRHAVIAGEIP